MKTHSISFKDIPQFSDFDRSYRINPEQFGDLLNRIPEATSFQEQIEAKRTNYTFDRALLTKVIQSQYDRIGLNDSIITNRIEQLQERNTYTVITAHQPSLFTGPLYTIYKIASAIVHARKLNSLHPEVKVLPVFIIGGEDHDFEEINHFYYRGHKFFWEDSTGGPVGRIDTSGIQQVIDEIRPHLQVSYYGKEILQLLKESYLEHKTLGDATHFFISQLFGDTELIVAQMDEPAFKKAFSPIIEKEILHSNSRDLILQQQEKLKSIGFSPQAFVREINFFYLSEGRRDRIEQRNDSFEVLGTDIRLSANEMLARIKNEPERFSPNVIMRPIYQEFIFPNLAYIGGGGELAYWMDRKLQFESFDLEMPILIRRHSAAMIQNKQFEKLCAYPWAIEKWFSDEQKLIKDYLKATHAKELDFSILYQKMHEIFDAIKPGFSSLDSNYDQSAEAARVDALKTINRLEHKAMKALKRKEQNAIDRIQALRSLLLPNGKLQERNDNIIEWYQEYGPIIIKDIIDSFQAFEKKMKVIITP